MSAPIKFRQQISRVSLALHRAHMMPSPLSMDGGDTVTACGTTNPVTVYVCTLALFAATTDGVSDADTWTPRTKALRNDVEPKNDVPSNSTAPASAAVFSVPEVNLSGAVFAVAVPAGSCSIAVLATV